MCHKRKCGSLTCGTTPSFRICWKPLGKEYRLVVNHCHNCQKLFGGCAVEKYKLQAHGQRAAWEDPSDWILETYPFQLKSDAAQTSLLKVRAEDVGYDVSARAQNGEQSGQRSRTQSDADSDPLVSSSTLKNHVHLTEQKIDFLFYFVLTCS